MGGKSPGVDQRPAATGGVKAAVEPIEVDILQMELDRGSPHWLSPQARFAHTHDDERKRKHDQYQAEKKAKREAVDKKWIDIRRKSMRLLRLRAFDPNEPRDPLGEWTDGGGGSGGGGGDKPSGGGKREHPGPGYSASAYVKDGVIHTNNVYDAQRALFENRHVELNQPKQVSTLIKRLGETAKEMAEHHETAPVFNLCNVSIAGTNLFCAESKGIPRVEMPVIPAKQTKAFIKYLKGEGFRVEKDNERAENLRATQNEISGAKVAASMARIEKEGFYKRLVVSKDDYILDGHHTWAGQLGVDAKNNDLHADKSVKVARVNISITKLIAAAEKFTGGKGKKPASEEAKSIGQILGELFADEAERERASGARAMPIHPGKDEKQDDWMQRCVPDMMGKGPDGGTKRPQDQAVAACLTMWRDAKGEPKPTKQINVRQDAPKAGDDKDGFMQRCVLNCMTSGMAQDAANEYCRQMWETSSPGGKSARAKQAAAVAAKQVDPPDPDEDDFDDWMEDCVDQLMESSDEIDEDAATDRCSIMWEEASIPGRPGGLHTFDGSRVRHKTHAAEVQNNEYILSDESVDRMGDIISANGWDLRHFKNNPVALFNHHSDFPIGVWRDLRVESGALRGHLELAPEGTSARIDEIRKLVAAKILRAVSVGFRVLQSEPRRADKNGGGSGFLGEHFTKQELIETSLVSVPANPNALAVAKQLSISPATIDFVFAKPGSKQNGDDTRRRTHRQARRNTSHNVSRAMTGNTSPLGQRIQASQQRLVRYQDQLTEHLKNVNDESPADTDMAVSEDLNTKIAKEDMTLKSLIESEKRLALTSIAPGEEETRSFNGSDRNGNGSTALAVHSARPFAIAARKLKPIDYMWRSLTVQVLHHNEQGKRPILDVLKDAYGEDEPTRQVMGLITRAASAPALTNQPGWAQELVTQVWMDFIEALLPFSIYPEIARRGQSFTFGRNGVINLPMRNRTPQISGAFVGEGAPIPVRQGSFATVQLTPKKMAVISTFTRELSEHSTPAIESLIREAITNDTAIALDSVLIDANPATAVRPPGLLNGTTGLTPVPGGDISALIGDIKILIDALNVSTLGNLRDPVWLMNPGDVAAAALTPTSVGILPFREEIARGTLMSFPIVKSASVPADTMIFMDCADFASVTEAAPRFDVSDQAVLHMEDTDPLALIGGTTGTPVPAVPTRSLWQTDTIGVRMILPMNWVMRRPGMVQWISGMTWAA